MSLIQKKRTLGAKMKAALLVPCVLVLISGCFAATAWKVSLQAQDESQQSGGASNQKIYKVGPEVSAPERIAGNEPEFPASAPKRRDFEGKCVLSLTVDKTGKPQQVRITRSLAPDFDANAIKAVQQWQFKPATLKATGEPVPVSVTVEVTFKRY